LPIWSVYFGEIIKIVATRSHLLKLKCTKFDFGCSSAPDFAGKLTALSQTLLLDFRGSYFCGKREERKGEDRKRGKR